MKLTYRGVSYDYNPPQVEYGDRSQVGKYRGVDIRFRTIKKAPVQKPTLDLLYRGAAYSTNSANPVEVETEVETEATVEAPVAASVQPVTTPPASSVSMPSVKEQARLLLMGHHKNVKRRQQAMLSRLDARVGVPVSEATRFWNHVRGEAHPSFTASYDRSGAAMS